jgi:dTDP-4-amino-4,6-dideoxygalactose transaminase
MVPFHRPTRVAEELASIAESLREGQSASASAFGKLCAQRLSETLGVSYAAMTTSCTHALELAALALGVEPGSDVVVPSFTFTSTANAFVLRGARIRFADIQPDTLNLDPRHLDRLVSRDTRAIIAMHYAGVACDMDAIMAIAGAHGATVVEDAAHALFGFYRGRPLGTIGAIGTFSFHRTKNFSCDEGGAFVTDNSDLAEAAEIIREKGTNRAQFLRGMIQKYEWVRDGSSYVLAEILAAQLFAQLEQAAEIQNKRRNIWVRYQDNLRDWAEREGVRQPHVPEGCEPAWHLYYLVMPSPEARDRLLDDLRADGIGAAFHYPPLHLTPMGRRLGGRPGDAPVAEWVAERLLRLPFYTDLSESDQARVVDAVCAFRCGPIQRSTTADTYLFG